MHGNYATHMEIPIRAHDEVGIVMGAFNDMRKKLSEWANQIQVLNEKLSFLASTDVLTGVNNRRQIEKCLSVEMERARRTVMPFSILMLDLDHFKVINDTFGHAIGDTVLTSAAQAIRVSLRSMDVVGRYGGEEFLVLLPNTGLEKAVMIAERIRTQLHAINIQPQNISVSASIGAAEFSGQTSDKIIHAADQKMYSAKSQGRDKVVY